MQGASPALLLTLKLVEMLYHGLLMSSRARDYVSGNHRIEAVVLTWMTVKQQERACISGVFTGLLPPRSLGSCWLVEQS